MIYRLINFASAMSAMAMPTLAHAQPTMPFAAKPVSDQILAATRGAASPDATLSRGTLTRLTDAQSRSDFSQATSVTVVQMEVWWGTVGSELIANAVRNRF